MDAKKIIEKRTKVIEKASATEALTNGTLGAMVFEIFSETDEPITRAKILEALAITVKEYGKGTIKHERAQAVIDRLQKLC